MQDNTLPSLKSQYALEVYEKFKENTFRMEGFYSEERLLCTEMTIDLLQHNINPDDIIQ
jgi:hypothetical protein